MARWPDLHEKFVSRVNKQVVLLSERGRNYGIPHGSPPSWAQL